MKKAAGKPIEYEEPVERSANVVDLMEALRQSVSGHGNRIAALRSSASKKRARSKSSRRSASAKRKSLMARDADGIRKRIAFDIETWQAVDRLAKDRMVDLQDLADEAFRDLLRKHRRPVTLKDMLRESARAHPANDHQPTQAAPVMIEISRRNSCPVITTAQKAVCHGLIAARACPNDTLRRCYNSSRNPPAGYRDYSSPLMARSKSLSAPAMAFSMISSRDNRPKL